MKSPAEKEKCVLISIQPEWCDLIGRGEKTVEVRKSMPSLKPPFRCYIYCSAPGTTDANRILESHGRDGKIRKVNGNVMGEFVCDSIMKINRIGAATCWTLWPVNSVSLEEHYPADDAIEESCLSDEELQDYLDTNSGYIWHISNLDLYEIPKSISEFKKYNAGWKLDRPPQSWFYVDKL